MLCTPDIMRIMSGFLLLHHKPQSLNFSAVLGAGGHDVNACGVDAAVAQNVRQLGNVLFNAVKRPGEQLAQIVGKDLAGLHPPPLHRAFSYPTRYYSGLGSCHCG